MEVWGRFQESLRVNRLGVLYFFSLEGGSIGVFMAFLVRMQQSLGLNDNRLGTAVFFFYLGEMIGTPVVAAALRRFGAKQSTFGGSLLFSSMLVIVSFGNSFVLLCLLFLLLGLAECALDVSMNALAVIVEIVVGYPIVGSFHGSYSVSAAIGGVIGGILVASGYIQLHVMSVICALTYMISTFFGIAMYTRDDEILIEQYRKAFDGETTEDTCGINCNDDQNIQHGDESQSIIADEASNNVQQRVPDTDGSQGVSLHSVDSKCQNGEHYHENALMTEHNQQNESKDSRLPSTSLLELLMLPKSSDMAAISALCFLAAYGESALTTWIIFFFRREFDVGDSGVFTTLGFSLFEAFMGVGRFFVDVLRARIGSNRMVFYGGCCTLFGMAMIISSPYMGSRFDSASLPYMAACLGCSLSGFGLSTLIPMSYISAGYCEGHGPTNISVVATWAGAGSIASSPIVGAVSTALGSLRLSMLILTISLAPIVALLGSFRAIATVLTTMAIFNEVQKGEI